MVYNTKYINLYLILFLMLSLVVCAKKYPHVDFFLSFQAVRRHPQYIVQVLHIKTCMLHTYNLIYFYFFELFIVRLFMLLRDPLTRSHYLALKHQDPIQINVLVSKLGKI